MKALNIRNRKKESVGLAKYKSGKGNTGWAAILLGHLTLSRQHANVHRVNFLNVASQIHPTFDSAVDGARRLVLH